MSIKLTIRGEPWRIFEGEILGMCNYEDHEIIVRTKMRPKWRLATLVHELIHAANPDLTEEEVTALDTVLLDGLWADGWRRDKNHGKEKVKTKG